MSCCILGQLIKDIWSYMALAVLGKTHHKPLYEYIIQTNSGWCLSCSQTYRGATWGNGICKNPSPLGDGSICSVLQPDSSPGSLAKQTMTDGRALRPMKENLIISRSGRWRHGSKPCVDIKHFTSNTCAAEAKRDLQIVIYLNVSFMRHVGLAKNKVADHNRGSMWLHAVWV